MWILGLGGNNHREVRLTKTVSIIAIGDELLCGRVLDTNSNFLACLLPNYGLQLVNISILPDRISDICEGLISALPKFDLIITTGGLGPTSDDLTRDAVSFVTKKELVPDQLSLNRLHEYARVRGREFVEINKRQAYFPKGAEILENEIGTANAFVARYEKTSAASLPIVCLPGVPSELHRIAETTLAEWLSKNCSFKKEHNDLFIKVFGLPESVIATQIEAVAIDERINIAYRPRISEVLITLSIKSEHSEDSDIEKALECTFETVKKAIGEKFIFSYEQNSSLAVEVFKLLETTNSTLSLAESCSGGLLADKIVSVPGASKYFLGSMVAYSNTLKHDILGVSNETLVQHGAVSEQTAIEMALGVRRITQSTYALSITGIAGPKGGTNDKPVGLVYIGCSSAKSDFAISRQLHGERAYIREYASALALDLLRRTLSGYRHLWL